MTRPQLSGAFRIAGRNAAELIPDATLQQSRIHARNSSALQFYALSLITWEATIDKNLLFRAEEPS